jgi:hypothetical protein
MKTDQEEFLERQGAGCEFNKATNFAEQLTNIKVLRLKTLVRSLELESN